MTGERGVSRPLKFVLAAGVLLAVGLLIAAGVFFVATPDRVAAKAADSVDVGFAQDMSAHHLQGVQMANIARERSGDPAIRQLAFDVETSQLEQAGRMKGWLGLWNQPELPLGGYMTWMRQMPSHGQHGQGAQAAAVMPGMASAEELAKLRGSAGTEFDTFFLQLMVRHHQGGAPMMSEAAERAEQPQVRNLAQQMLNAQSTEIEVMNQMLAERGAKPLPAPN
ncbi:DUF305 domain-containing protein [Saccharopolyspora sp. NPDC050642]|uniref:DUF305 domain-containing protein n=1 Tax=Saccharopolyspora sp. NPDC050642 TaxID=3157099 RepID=UPI0033FDFDD3